MCLCDRPTAQLLFVGTTFLTLLRIFDVIPKWRAEAFDGDLAVSIHRGVLVVLGVKEVHCGYPDVLSLSGTRARVREEMVTRKWQLL